MSATQALRATKDIIFRPRAGFTWNRQSFIMLPVIAFMLYLVIVPLIFLLWSSFRTTPIGVPGPLTLQNYVRAYTDSQTYSLLGNTLIFSAGSVAVSVLLGVGFAWLLERTNVPFKDAIYTFIPIPMIVPGILFSIAWVLLLSPTIGLVNVSLVGFFNLSAPPINIYSLPSMILLDGLHSVPITFLILSGAFRRMDPALEEASAVAGAGILTTLHRITMRVLSPTVLAAVIYLLISAIDSFEIPGVIGLRAGIHVLALKIYLAKQGVPPDYGLIGTLSILLLGLSALLAIFYGRLTRESARYATITGKNYSPKIYDLGRCRYAALVFFAAYFLLTVVLPVFVLVWASLLPFYQVPSAKALSTVSLAKYWELWEFPNVGLAFTNTFLMVLCAPTITMLICSIFSWFIVKARVTGSRVLDVLAFLPHAIPGVVLGVALMWTYAFIPLHIYGTLWILLIAYVTSRIPFGTRLMNAAMAQLHKELEEASYTSGGTWGRTFRKITLPLLLPAVMNGWLVSAILVAKAMGTVIMLYGQDSIVISVLVWELWERGDVPGTAAVGVVLIVLLMAVTFCARKYVARAL
ncbi:MAG: ABC transporter permease [Candidatus Binatia bacterium]